MTGHPIKDYPLRLVVFIPAAAVWLSLIGAGAWWQTRIETAPGTASVAPATWPSDSSLARTPGRAVWIAAIHPRCPCSRATLTELEALMADHPTVDAFILLTVPAGSGSEWQATDTCRRAREMPGVTTLIDSEGILARRFGMQTSGHVVVYSASGCLTFSGGITPGRGQTGDNPGRQALTAWAVLQPPTVYEVPMTRTPVFGCALVGAEECRAQGGPP